MYPLLGDWHQQKKSKLFPHFALVRPLTLRDLKESSSASSGSRASRTLKKITIIHQDTHNRVCEILDHRVPQNKDGQASIPVVFSYIISIDTFSLFYDEDTNLNAINPKPGVRWPERKWADAREKLVRSNGLNDKT